MYFRAKNISPHYISYIPKSKVFTIYVFHAKHPRNVIEILECFSLAFYSAQQLSGAEVRMSMHPLLSRKRASGVQNMVRLQAA